MAAFSRLQLAAALIEYDNDNDDPTSPRRSAHDSAIFAHLRRNNPPRRPTASRRSTDYLGVSLPSEGGSTDPRDSVVAGDRRSRGGSIDALHNPFNRESTYEGFVEEEEEEPLEVDLTSWGLDAFIPKDKEKEKESKAARRKAKSEVFPNPHPQYPPELSSGLRSDAGRRHTPGTRTMSMGNVLDHFGEGGAFLDAQSSSPALGSRRHSFGSPLDLPPMQPAPQRRRTPSVHALIENLPVTPPLHSIPFPTSESVRSVSPMPNESMRPSSRGPLAAVHGRAHSTASLGSGMLLNDDEELPNPFAVKPPSPDRASRFDPKFHARATSNATMGTMMTPGLMAEESNPFALRPPSPSRGSRFDPKVRARTMSNGSLGTQMMLDNDQGSSDGGRSPRPRLYSRLELMRPKVLIMPSPLQSTVPTAAPVVVAREGFEISPEAPLPPGARSTRRASSTMSMLDLSTPAPIASNSFTPNPRASLTLAQLTFRNALAVDGQRDVAYTDIDARLHRATEDGQQIEFEPEEEAPVSPVPEIILDGGERSRRPAGKLYGKSLIDDLEARKIAMQNKRRVFTGDERPSMMARSQVKRSSTLIDPESLKRPTSQRMDSFYSTPDLARRNSANAKTLIQLDDEIPGARQHLGVDPVRPGVKRSVFGVDTLWERELAKLRQMEEADRVEAEERTKREAQEELSRPKKGKGKGKKRGRRKDEAETPDGASAVPEPTPEPQPASPSFVLPTIQKTVVRKVPPPSADDDTESESDSSDVPAAQKRASQVADWYAGSSDEEKRGPRRTTGSGPRHPQPTRIVQQNDDSSEEDLPLVATIGRAAQRMTQASRVEDDSDEEQPLAVLLDKRLRLPSMGSMGSGFLPGETGGNDDDDDDNKPLGLRASRAALSSQAFGSADQEEDDDKPLGLHPDQMRRTQYMMAAQQQQQQQMMLQMQAAQMQQSMIFGAPSMMSSGFFGPMPPPMMMPPQLPMTPPPVEDTVKFGRVDKWRHDVAVEGEP
ncbi:hypothetical protein B0H21DRAFT_717066 [Amylocystis lapponica]|nr:hypothetical protein B0H21DRAFT_717066 [Amylocystis lapponica]